MDANGLIDQKTIKKSMRYKFSFVALILFWLCFVHPAGKIAEKAVWRSAFGRHGIAYSMPIQQKLTPPVLLFCIFANILPSADQNVIIENPVFVVKHL